MSVAEPTSIETYFKGTVQNGAVHITDKFGGARFGPEYPKINTVFKRDMANNGLIIRSQFSTDEFTFLADVPWRWTEKVDGTNIRVHFDGTRVTIGGRTDAAQLPGHLMFALAKLNHPALWNRVFADSTRVKPYEQDVTVYGEGYGPKIQSGGQYRDDVDFIVFDIKVGRWWLKHEDVREIAVQLGLDVVPEYDNMTLNEAIGFVSGEERRFGPEFFAFKSHWLNAKPEGIVGTPLVPLFARNGERIVAKLKRADFEAVAKHEERRILAEPKQVVEQTYPKQVVETYPF